jgi:ankyrin repeat protein
MTKHNTADGTTFADAVANLNISSPANEIEADDDGWKAVMRACEIDGPDRLKTLINARTNYKLTPLMGASFMGKLECVQQLLAVDGINLDAMPDDGCTALAYAALAGHVNIVELLIAHGANVNTKNIYNKTVLHFASEGNNVECVRLLLNIIDMKMVDKVTGNGETVPEFDS